MINRDLLHTLKQFALYRLDRKGGDIPFFKSIARLLLFRLTWKKRNIDYSPSGLDCDKFMSARKAVAMIPDGSTLFTTGIAANSRCSIFYWAIRERFMKTGSPRGITLVALGGVGGRGKAPGTIEELGVPGLVDRHISAHLETHKSLLMMADRGLLELHTMPMGVLAFLVEAQGRGVRSIKTGVGTGTFVDPRSGPGTIMTLPNPGSLPSLSRPSGKLLKYSLPTIDVACFCAPYADREGNIYFKNAAVITDNLDGVRAAKAAGGIALATVSGIIEKDEKSISIPASMIDAVVVNPRNEQTGGVLQTNYYPMFTQGASADIKEAYLIIKLINLFMGITPQRGKTESTIARMAASLFVEEARPGAVVNIGVGLPEEVSRLLFESGLYNDLVFTTESGIYNGLPTSGIYFGAGINPERIISSSAMFHLYEKELDVAVLGFLQVDSKGNVNVSRKSGSLADYVGPGGFPNITSCAKTIIFVGNWMDGAKYSLRGGLLKIKKPGIGKFVSKVDEITFNADAALRDGKNVYYVTTIGIFRLTVKGLELIEIMPGISTDDIRATCGSDIVIPAWDFIPKVRPETVSGRGFSLQWKIDSMKMTPN